MTSNYDITRRWAERIVEPDKRERSSRAASVFSDGDRIYSYGRHFEMARVVRDKRGKPSFVLLNGDNYSVTTSRHQNDLRDALRASARGIPTMIVPHMALSAARIDIDSIKPLDVRPDGMTYEKHRGPLPKTAERGVGIRALRWGGEGYRRTQEGESYIVLPGGEEVREVEPGVFEWHVGRHWLGDAVFAARSHGQAKRVKWLSSFDRNEPRPLYFLCQLPPTRATTYEEAIEALKPDTVLMAEAMGRAVERQGDIFAVPMPGLTLNDLKAQGGRMARRYDAMGPLRSERRIRAMWDAIIDGDRLGWQARNVYTWGTRKTTIPWNEHGERVTDVRRHRERKWAPILEERHRQVVEAAPDRAEVSLLGTAHTGTHVVTMPDGTQYARGVMYHDPALMGERRERDHVRCPLGDGKTWHLIAKNTVPTTKARNGRRGGVIA